MTISGIIKNSRKIKKSKYKKGFIELTIMCIPALALVAMFNYFPMFGLLIAFKNYTFSKGILGSQWVGLNNFKFFFTSPDLVNITRNTLLLNLGLIIFSTFVSIVLALMLYEISNRLLIKTYQTIMFFPYFLSWVVIAYIGYAFFNESYGILNKILGAVGMSPVSWYSESGLWPFILIMAGSWKYIGYNTVIYYSSLMAIDSEYFEAATIDGASKLRTIMHISIPFITPVVIMLTLLSLGRIFYSDFGLFWFLPMQSGMLIPATDVIDTYVFRSLRVIGDIGIASAVNFYQSVMGMATILIFNFIVRKVNSESSLF